jgi:hypothetical protein
MFVKRPDAATKMDIISMAALLCGLDKDCCIICIHAYSEHITLLGEP